MWYLKLAINQAEIMVDRQENKAYSGFKVNSNYILGLFIFAELPLIPQKLQF